MHLILWTVLLTLDRDGCTWFFDQLQASEIPLLIFSAGIGDVIIEVIKHQATLHDNMKVVSNYLEYDEQVSPRVQGLYSLVILTTMIWQVLAKKRPENGSVWICFPACIEDSMFESFTYVNVFFEILSSPSIQRNFTQGLLSS